MDQIVKALGLINSFQINGLHGECNPTTGARLNLTGGLGSLSLTADDGDAPGITIESQGFGIGDLSLPTPQDPSIALDPYLSHLRVDLHKALFERLAVFAEASVLAGFDEVINRVMVRRMRTVVRLTSKKVVHADVEIDQVFLQNGSEELIRVRDLSLSLLDFDTTLPPAEAQAACTVVLRGLRVEIEQALFERALKAARPEIPSFIRDIFVELPGPLMNAGGSIKKGPLGTSFKVDLKFETENEQFGIIFDKFYVPGTKVRLPDMFRTLLLTAIRKVGEGKMKGLVEVSNESIRIDPWSKVPVKLLTHVQDFCVEDGKIVVVFTEPSDKKVPAKADVHCTAAEREPTPRDIQNVLAPGPAL